MNNENDEIINTAVNLTTGIRKEREIFLTDLDMLRKAQLELFEQEFKSLSSIPLTEPDPRMKTLEEDIQATKEAIKAIAVQLEIGRIIVPNVKEGEILVHGRIAEENGHGIRNVVVSPLVNGKALDVKGKSDTSGYYSIVMPSQIIDSIKDNDINLYFYLRKELIHMSSRPIKLTGQEVKYEVALDKSELKNVYTQQKVKKASDEIRKPA